jgi:hypothetical protein
MTVCREEARNMAEQIDQAPVRILEGAGVGCQGTRSLRWCWCMRHGGTGVRSQGFDRAGDAPWRSDTARGTRDVLGSAVPAFILIALVSGTAGVRDLGRLAG